MALISIEILFDKFSSAPSDINEHLRTLREYASRSAHVTEIGCWRGYSSLALLAGLRDRGGGHLHLLDIDRGYLDNVVRVLTPYLGNVDLTVTCGSSLEVDIPVTDFLFIDSWHVYRQLREELSRHGNQARGFIACHDTVSFGESGEDGSEPGLRAALEEFVESFPQWAVIEDFENNNGLMVLECSG